MSTVKVAREESTLHLHVYACLLPPQADCFSSPVGPSAVALRKVEEEEVSRLQRQWSSSLCQPYPWGNGLPCLLLRQGHLSQPGCTLPT